MRLSIECPAGGIHEIVSVIVSIASKPAKHGYSFSRRVCSKCGLWDTFIQEAPP